MSKTIQDLRWVAGEIEPNVKEGAFIPHQRELTISHKQGKWLLKKLRELGYKKV